MKLAPDGPAREPDILFVARDNLERAASIGARRARLNS